VDDPARRHMLVEVAMAKMGRGSREPATRTDC
jgi:hypothetical protein